MAPNLVETQDPFASLFGGEAASSSRVSTAETQDPFASLFAPARQPGRQAPDRQRIREWVLRYAREYGVPTEIALRLVNQESGFDPNAVSSAGAVGVMQLMPTTARELGVDPRDPEANIRGGMQYLAEKYREFGNWPDALAAYNAGSDAVRSGRALRYPETSQYVKAILGGTPYAFRNQPGLSFRGQPIRAEGHTPAWLREMNQPAPVSEGVPAGATPAGQSDDPFAPLFRPAQPAAPSQTPQTPTKGPEDTSDPFAPLFSGQPSPGVRSPTTTNPQHESILEYGRDLIRGIERGLTLGFIRPEDARTQAGRIVQSIGNMLGETPYVVAASLATEGLALPALLRVGLSGAMVGGGEASVGTAVHGEPASKIPGAAASGAVSFMAGEGILRVFGRVIRAIAGKVGASAEDVANQVSRLSRESGQTPGQVIQHMEGTLAQHEAQQISLFDDIQQGLVNQAGASKNTPSPSSLLRGLVGEQPLGIVPPGSQAAADLVQQVQKFVGDTWKVGPPPPTEDIEDALYTIGKRSEESEIRARHLLEQIQGTMREVDPNNVLIHYDEDHSIPLTPEQRRIYDTVIRPLKDATEEIYAKLKGIDPNMLPDEFTNRYVKDRGNIVDKALAEGKRRLSLGGNLSTAAGFMQHRSMKALVDAQGVRRVIHIGGDGKITAFDRGKATVLGSLRDKSNLANWRNLNRRWRYFTDAKGQTFEIKDSTIREIEANTDIRYHKDILATRLLTYLKAVRLNNNVEFLDRLKTDPEWSKFAQKIDPSLPLPTTRILGVKGFKEVPWRAVSIPQLKGYIFDPHVANSLERWAKLHYSIEEPDFIGFMGGLNRILRNAIFFNPMLHIPNVGTHWFMARGLTRWAMPSAWKSLARTSARAFEALRTQNEDYLRLLHAGAPLMGNEFKGNALTKLLLDKMGRDLENDPVTLTKLAKALFSTPRKLLDMIYDLSHRMTWQTNDLLVMQAIFEEEARGKTLDEAIRLVGKHIPNYRVPAEILNSRQLSSLWTNPNLTMFGSYHYGVLKNWGQIGKELIDSSLPPAERFAALDRLAAFGLMMSLYPIMDTLAQHMTGDRRTYVRRYGPARIAENLWQLSRNQRDYVSVLTSLLTPAPATLAFLESFFNRDLWTGRSIRDPYHPERIPWVVLQEFGRNFAPLTFGTQAFKSPGKALEGFGGVVTPKYSLAERRLLELRFEERDRVHTQMMEAMSRGDVKTATDLMMQYNLEVDQVLRQIHEELGTSYSPLAVREMHLRLPTLRNLVNWERSHGR